MRDEKRPGGPRMHGRNWHDHREPRAFTGDAEMAELDARPEAEHGGDIEGMRKVKKGRQSRSSK